MMPTATCQYCGWNGPADQCGPLKNAWERLQPGDTVPAGECPKCNASAMLDETRQEPSATIVTTLVPERATKFGVRSTAEALADVMWLAANRYSYRVRGPRIIRLPGRGLPRDTEARHRSRAGTCASRPPDQQRTPSGREARAKV